jgi:C4-dicarboxylate transporter
VYQPTTGDPSTTALGLTSAFNLVVTATGTGNTPVAAFATVIDEQSNDLLFIPGKKPSSAP